MPLLAESPQRPREAEALRLKVLLVSEDPETIVEVQRALKPVGVRVVGCVGPANAPCFLEEYDTCPFAMHADVAIVDVPASGSFIQHWREIPAGQYAERLALKHPDCFVILAEGYAINAGPSGDVAHSRDLQTAIDLVWSMATHPARHRGRFVMFDGKDEDR